MQRRDFLLASALCAAPLASWAQPQTLRALVPYAAGGAIDLNVRKLGQAMGQELGNFVVENRPGAGGSVGLASLAKMPADGRTIGVAAVATIGINPWLLDSLGYDPLKDFAAIAQLTRVPNVLVMNAEQAKQKNIDSFDSFVAYIKAHPDELSFGSGGMGSAGHLAGESFNQRTGARAVHVPYGGGAPSQLALMSGEVNFSFDNLATVAANVRSGKVIALAVTSAQRSPLLEGLPAVAETYEGFVFDTWWGLVAPAGTPEAELTRLHTAVAAAQASDAMKAFYDEMMMERVQGSRQEFSDLMRSEYQRYEAIVANSGAKNN